MTAREPLDELELGERVARQLAEENSAAARGRPDRRPVTRRRPAPAPLEPTPDAST